MNCNKYEALIKQCIRWILVYIQYFKTRKCTEYKVSKHLDMFIDRMMKNTHRILARNHIGRNNFKYGWKNDIKLHLKGTWQWIRNK
jgi:hypothetical protein